MVEFSIDVLRAGWHFQNLMGHLDPITHCLQESSKRQKTTVLARCLDVRVEFSITWITLWGNWLHCRQNVIGKFPRGNLGTLMAVERGLEKHDCFTTMAAFLLYCNWRDVRELRLLQCAVFWMLLSLSGHSVYYSALSASRATTAWWWRASVRSFIHSSFVSCWCLYSIMSGSATGCCSQGLDISGFLRCNAKDFRSYCWLYLDVETFRFFPSGVRWWQ